MLIASCLYQWFIVIMLIASCLYKWFIVFMFIGKSFFSGLLSCLQVAVFISGLSLSC